jgi:pilus assembly protein CpaE
MSRLVLATADTDFEARLHDAFGGELEGTLRYWCDDMLDDPKHTVRSIANGGARVVALGPDLTGDPALELVRTFDQERPDISVVIVAPPTTTLLQSALRAGARDVISPETPARELRAAFERAFDNASLRRGALDPMGTDGSVTERRVIMCLCPKGGAGKTAVSTNLALALAHVAPGEVVIVDLDLQFGDVASALGMRPERGFSDAMLSIGALDETSLKAYLTFHADELYALCAPDTPIEAEGLTGAQVQRVLELLVLSFRYLVIDTSSGLDESTLAALDFATDLVLLSATDVPSVRATIKEVAALRQIGNPYQTWHFVLNRADARTGLTIPAIERAVGLPVDIAIPSSRAVPISLNQGKPLVAADPRSPVSLAMLQLASRVAPRGVVDGKGSGRRPRKRQGAS